MKPVRNGQLVTMTTHIEHKSSQTVLEYLCNRFSYHNETEWLDRIASGKVKVNGLKPSGGQPLRAGDEMTYTTEAWEEPEVNKNYRIVYEDEALLVVSKPAPLPVHAIGVYFQNTLMHLLRAEKPEADLYHLVHRIDSETSGLLLIAKDKKHMPNLTHQWADGQVQKSYQAIVFGHFEPRQRRVEKPIATIRGGAIRMKAGIDSVNGKPSVTDFECLETKGKFSLVEAKPLTGRTHQIRVHLESEGHSIVGDKLYSGNQETFLRFVAEGWTDWLAEQVLLPRMALHASKLEFSHPVTGTRMTLEDPLPVELKTFWDNAG
ncbi:MAG TPA: RluA family pseudouridine synthase [bacterium]|nr:RluA family pseudouridine synthase [bacterium]